jgi:hypothetical protein
VRERAACWWDTDAKQLSDEEFRSNFCMCWKTFYYVCDLVEARVQCKDTQFRDALDIERVVAMALWRLATGAWAAVRGSRSGRKRIAR